MLRKVFITGILFLMVAVCANAAQITQTSGTIDLLGSDSTWNVNAFNTNLGTLDSVTIDLWTTVNGQWSVTNIGTANVHTWGNVDGFTEADFNLTPTINGTSKATGSTTWDSVLTPTSPGDSTNGLISGSDSKSYAYSKGSNSLTSFDSPWAVTFNNDSDAKDKNVPATAYFMNYVSGTGKAVVAYNYTPTPEPSSLMVLLIGGAGLLSFARRRKT